MHIFYYLLFKAAKLQYLCSNSLKTLLNYLILNKLTFNVKFHVQFIYFLNSFLNININPQLLGRHQGICYYLPLLPKLLYIAAM